MCEVLDRVKTTRESSIMATNKIEQGPVSEQLAKNLRAIRDRRRLSQEDLAVALAAVGRPMQRSAIAKVEKGDRRVDVDDLVALALALNVTPARLLLPDVAIDDDVELTDQVRAPAWMVWQWMLGAVSLAANAADVETDEGLSRKLAYLDERPLWVRATESKPIWQAIWHLHWAVQRGVEGGRPSWIAKARQALSRVSDQLDELESEAGDGQRR
jgi:transcriptional regulator with XRE-family HTH domain